MTVPAVKLWRARVAYLALLAMAPLVLTAVHSSGAGDDQGVLRQTWEGYKHDFITADGRVRDIVRTRWIQEHLRSEQTTSEGQSYAMLRAVWMDDRATFNTVWRWTQSNLQIRVDDRLFAWLSGTAIPEGPWTVLSTDSASDADEDIALALIFAGHRWHDRRHLNEARAVLGDIWRKEVIRVRGRYYLTAGDWAPLVKDPGPALNPSYFAPYAYRIFSREDPSHAWQSLVDSSYDALWACSWDRLNQAGSVGLPPNWCALDATDGTVRPFSEYGRKDDYSWDAFRVMWRVALDYLWFGAPQAKSYLQGSAFLRQEWKEKHRLYAEYGHDGPSPFGHYENATLYGGDIGNFVVADPPAARSILHEKLLASVHRQGVFYWDDRYSYFEQNWVWFGVALATHRLPNLAHR